MVIGMDAGLSILYQRCGFTYILNLKVFIDLW